MFRAPESKASRFYLNRTAELVCHSALQMCTRNVQTNLVPLFSRVLLAGVRKRSPIYLFAFVALTLRRVLISTASYAGTFY
jgi:hypothetical protein